MAEQMMKIERRHSLWRSKEVPLRACLWVESCMMWTSHAKIWGKNIPGKETTGTRAVNGSTSESGVFEWGEHPDWKMVREDECDRREGWRGWWPPRPPSQGASRTTSTRRVWLPLSPGPVSDCEPLCLQPKEVLNPDWPLAHTGNRGQCVELSLKDTANCQLTKKHITVFCH